MAAPSPSERRDRQPAIGWIGLDAPVEVIAAAGRPVRLEADARSAAPRAAAFGEGGGHPWMRALADRVLAETDSLERVVIGAMPVSGVWLYNFFLTLQRGSAAPSLPQLDLVNISHEARPSASRLNRDSVAALVRRLGVSPDALHRTIRERNAVRRLQREIDALRHGRNRRLAGSDARALLDAADQMAPQDYLAFAAQGLMRARSMPPIELEPVVYSGPGSPSLELYRSLESHGLTVVGDDADFGTRAMGPNVEEGVDPIEALAERYARRDPAPAGWTTEERVKWLTALATGRGASAVVFDIPPWSHPPAWDLPAERRALEAIGVQCIVLPQAEPMEAAAAGIRALGSEGRQAHG